MSIFVDEKNYRYIRNNDPSYQAMVRVSDTNNSSDIVQHYVKFGADPNQNDFAKQIELFHNNVGILNDGIHIDMSNFFTETTKKITVDNDGKTITTVSGKTIPYFKFKTNRVLNFTDKSHIRDTYIDKTNSQTIYELVTNNSEDIVTLADEKTLKENTYNSYPLQRVDKLTGYELDSLFLYIDGRKIPDNEIFVYTNKSFTDVFIPEKYIPGNIHNESSYIDTTFHVEYRRAGAESFYYRETITGKNIVIDLNETVTKPVLDKYGKQVFDSDGKPIFKQEEKYLYNKDKIAKTEFNKHKFLIFANGFEIPINHIKNCSNQNGLLTIELFDYLDLADVEVYILNNAVFRYSINEQPTHTILENENILHFYINENGYLPMTNVDTICGPLTKTAISFFYKGERINDELIQQTSRFSFKFTQPAFVYRLVNFSSEPIPGMQYYVKDKNGKYEKIGSLSYWDPSKRYYVKEDADSINTDEIDYIIEDMGYKVDDFDYTTYGDDYYLLNMLGVKRCVDKLKGNFSYSIFDKDQYSINFYKVLSDYCNLFDVDKTIKKYDEIENVPGTPETRIKKLISTRPTLIRDFLEQFKIPSKKFIVLGNRDDVKISNVTELETPDDEIYYKVYVNHKLLEPTKYTVERDRLHDYITIDKSVLLPYEEYDNGGQLVYRQNEIELFQYDLSYRSKLIYRCNVSKREYFGNDSYVDQETGDIYFIATIPKSDLPFPNYLVNDDICAIEKVKKEWFYPNEPEYNFFYPTLDNEGYRLVKKFEILENNDEYLKFKIGLYKNTSETTNGEFFLMAKQYNVVEQFIFDNSDNTFMEENDLLIPLYTSYIERTNNGIQTWNYIPFINNSEPIITINGKEAIFGKDYTFTNPERNGLVTSSYIVFKNQISEDSLVNIQFNSSKTNILIVGYDDLEINNKYGLVYLSELPYPISPNYMNIFVNGEKLSSYDMDILSDKLVRFKNITRPIRSILITTNLQYKNSEISDYIELYEPSDFEILLSNIFWNCDPSKNIDSSKPNVDFVYKMNPFYEEFIGTSNEDEFRNTLVGDLYKYYTDEIISRKDLIYPDTEFEIIIPKPDVNESNYESVIEAWTLAKNFFDTYRWNHGFITDVDSIQQVENPYDPGSKENFISDTLEIMYLNWLAKSGKTRTYGFKADSIDPIVLNYFSIYENVIINDRIDIVVDSNRMYKGLNPKVTNEMVDKDELGNIVLKYPGLSYNEKRRVFYEMLIQALEKRATSEINYKQDSIKDKADIMKSICDNKLSNILYPKDFVLKPDSHGIHWTGCNVDIVNINNAYIPPSKVINGILHFWIYKFKYLNSPIEENRNKFHYKRITKYLPSDIKTRRILASYFAIENPEYSDVEIAQITTNNLQNMVEIV